MPSESPLVSVVIPTYNYARYVGEAVESVLAQTYPAVEVIVVDDGSTDDTRDRLAAYGDRIRYIYQPNAGLPAARNTGIRAATGGYLAFLDSDDLFHPRKLEFQMDLFAARPELGLVGTGQFSDDPPQWADVASGSISHCDLSLESVVTRTRFKPSSVVARKECFATVGLFDPTLRSVEDREMWIRIAAQFNLAIIDQPLTWYRITPGSMSRNPERMAHFERLVIDRAFNMPSLQQRRLLKLKAMSLAAFAASLMYREAGMHSRATYQAIRSIWLWPFPHRVADLRPLTRLKFLCLMPKFLARGSRKPAGVRPVGEGC